MLTSSTFLTAFLSISYSAFLKFINQVNGEISVLTGFDGIPAIT